MFPNPTGEPKKSSHIRKGPLHEPTSKKLISINVHESQHVKTRIGGRIIVVLRYLGLGLGFNIASTPYHSITLRSPIIHPFLLIMHSFNSFPFCLFSIYFLRSVVCTSFLLYSDIASVQSMIFFYFHPPMEPVVIVQSHFLVGMMAVSCLLLPPGWV